MPSNLPVPLHGGSPFPQAGAPQDGVVPIFVPDIQHRLLGLPLPLQGRRLPFPTALGRRLVRKQIQLLIPLLTFRLPLRLHLKGRQVEPAHQ